MSDEPDWSKMTIEEMFELKRKAKEEKSRRLTQLPVAKKFEIVEKFRNILNDALREDDERLASQQDPLASPK
jgi:hypothetical protein